MDMDHILKQVDWLDEERRKDKNALSSLDERIKALESHFDALNHNIKELSGETTRLNATLARFSDYDESLLQIRKDHKKDIDDLEKFTINRAEELEKLRRAENRGLEDSIGEIRIDLEQIPEIQQSLKARMEEELRTSREIDDVRNRIETVRRSEEEYTRQLRLLEDGRRQDSKRTTDLLGEVAAMRKRIDEQRGQLELATSTIKKIETRLNEIAVVETERREALNSFLENQTLKEVERERVWKEWSTRFDLIETQTTDVENNIQTLDATHRSVKRTQQSVDELSQKVERRINEITEIQRLSEERFRQEWVTFKADDQKRWTNYTLTMEEQRGETQRQQEQLNDKVTNLDDDFQEFKDLIDQMNELTENRLQALFALTHEWVSSYERSIGRSS